MARPPDFDKPEHVLRPRDSSHALASFISSCKDETVAEKHMSVSLSSTTSTLVDAATQTYWTSNASTQTELDEIKLSEKQLQLKEVPSPPSPSSHVKKIPTPERRGLLGKLCLLYEAEDPKKYPNKIKWFITLTVALAAATGPIGSSIIFRKCFALQPRWI